MEYANCIVPVNWTCPMSPIVILLSSPPSSTPIGVGRSNEVWASVLICDSCDCLSNARWSSLYFLFFFSWALLRRCSLFCHGDVNPLRLLCVVISGLFTTVSECTTQQCTRMSCHIATKRKQAWKCINFYHLFELDAQNTCSCFFALFICQCVPSQESFPVAHSAKKHAMAANHSCLNSGSNGQKHWNVRNIRKWKTKFALADRKILLSRKQVDNCLPGTDPPPRYLDVPP